ncbi:MAG: hypothetical protein ACXWUL_00235 [Caldimonas sp.]
MKHEKATGAVAVEKAPTGIDGPGIVVSGWGREDDRQKTADAGFDQHLVKPLDLRAWSIVLAAASVGPKPER